MRYHHFSAKIVQTEGKTKKMFIFLPRCSLSYPKIVQTEGKTKKIVYFFAEVQPILSKDSMSVSIMNVLEYKEQYF